MISAEGFTEACRALSNPLPTVAEFMANYQRLMAKGRCIPERILNVRALPPWAIDAGCD